MNEIIKINLNDNREPIVSARQLHQTLEVKKRFSAWFEQNIKGFVDGYETMATLSSVKRLLRKK